METKTAPVKASQIQVSPYREGRQWTQACPCGYAGTTQKSSSTASDCLHTLLLQERLFKTPPRVISCHNTYSTHDIRMYTFGVALHPPTPLPSPRQPPTPSLLAPSLPGYKPVHGCRQVQHSPIHHPNPLQHRGWVDGWAQTPAPHNHRARLQPTPFTPLTAVTSGPQLPRVRTPPLQQAGAAQSCPSPPPSATPSPPCHWTKTAVHTACQPTHSAQS